MRRLWVGIPKLSRWGVTAALALVLVYGVMHWAGCRDLVTILTGTVPDGVARGTAILFGVGYVVAYLACWIVVPVFVIAAGVYWGVSVIVRRRLK